VTGEPLLRREADGVATLTLNRPDKRNALDVATFQAIESAVADLERRTDEIGVVVLRGAGSCFLRGRGHLQANPLAPASLPGIGDRTAREPAAAGCRGRARALRNGRT
jgi:enoyl-CoA hydratase